MGTIYNTWLCFLNSRKIKFNACRQFYVSDIKAEDSSAETALEIIPIPLQE